MNFDSIHDLSFSELAFTWTPHSKILKGNHRCLSSILELSPLTKGRCMRKSIEDKFSLMLSNCHRFEYSTKTVFIQNKTCHCYLLYDLKSCYDSNDKYDAIAQPFYPFYHVHKATRQNLPLQVFIGPISFVKALGIHGDATMNKINIYLNLIHSYRLKFES